ncbi:MAG: hypothetical protein OXF84_06680 [Bacteroidetes bacterium]|nr:hypothetical protein [Bacteroidota bacterium]
MAVLGTDTSVSVCGLPAGRSQDGPLKKILDDFQGKLQADGYA